MIRLPARHLSASVCAAALALAAPLAAQQQPGTFTLPEATPTPGPAPAGPDDERAGVAIPPRAAPSATASPVIQPLPSPTAGAQPLPTPRRTGAATAAPPAALPTAPEALETPERAAVALPDDPLAAPSISALPSPDAPVTTLGTPDDLPGETALPDWWPYAAGGLGALVLLGGGMLWRRERKPKALRLAAPLAPSAGPDIADEQPRIDLTFEIIGATRSVMMFTVEYRLTIANRSDRAVTDVSTAVQLACARASANVGGSNAASAGAAQGLGGIARVGPHQARSITGQVQLPLSAIAPLRQGAAPLFIPLVHVTLEGDGLRAMTRSFVIGTPSAAGRVHPILLDQPPGAIAGLVAQAINIPPVSDAA